MDSVRFPVVLSRNGGRFLNRSHLFIGNIANLRYPAKNKILCWLVDISINTKRLVRIKVSMYD